MHTLTLSTGFLWLADTGNTYALDHSVKKAELTVRALKPFPSADWCQTAKEDYERTSDRAPFRPTRFLLPEVESQNPLEEILAETDNMGQREAHHLYESH
jgi:hypothetical protein